MYLVPVFSLIIIITLFLTKNTFHFILGNPTQEIRKIHSRPIIKIGGLSLLSISIYLFLTNDLLIINSIFFALIFFTIGLIADLRKNFNSKLRFFLMIAAILIFILVNDFKIYDLNHEFLNKIFLFSGVSTTLFIVFALMFITNGLNFIDGNNGLMLGITSLILINFNFHSYEYNSDINNYINCILLAVITLFIINFLTGKIICGDNGAYFLGFLIGTLSIILSNENIIYSTKIACIVFYPVFELFFTFWRRIFFEKKSPFEPDDLHLHSLVYKLLKNKFDTASNLNTINSLTSLMIITPLIFLSMTLFYYGEIIGFLNFFFIQTFLYILIYIHLYRYR